MLATGVTISGTLARDRRVAGDASRPPAMLDPEQPPGGYSEE
jgi:hypothetical protein